MKQNETLNILKQVADGALSPDEARLRFRMQPFEDLGFAKLDHHRAMRQGVAEVIYGASKTAEQIIDIITAILRQEQRTILITRLAEETASLVGQVHPLSYDRTGRVGIIGVKPVPDGIGRIVIATGGTSDLPVAEEAALTAEVLGNDVVRLYDVGVAGLHRLLKYLDDIMQARVIIAIAGMEGALASVIGGLADCPVIGVPTSVGYGASMNGLAALLSMLNACASGISVVNIDNGFGAGYLASMINHMGVSK
jgi:hypothetical protein